MKLAQDPWFKFTIARSIYKTILRFINSNHGKSYKIQPLPPKNFGIQLDDNGKATLKWYNIKYTFKVSGVNVMAVD